MKGNSVNATKNLLISKSYLKRFLAFVGATAITAAALTTSLSATEDTNEWETVDATPYVLWCPQAQDDGTFQQIEVGYVTGYDYSNSYDHSYLSLVTYMPLYKDCTYEIDFTVKYINVVQVSSTFNITNSLPQSVGDLTVQSNSAGDNYSDLISLTVSDYQSPSSSEEDEIGAIWYGSYVATNYTYSFSTASGFIDNFEDGYKYLTLSQIREPVADEGDPIQFMVTDISVKVIFDPGGDYYVNRVIEDLNRVAAELDEVGGKLSESESWLLEKAESMKSSVATDWSEALNQAAALVSPARSTVSILGPLSSFGTIFNTFNNSLPPVLKALIVACPVLMFIAWLIGRTE